MQTHIKELSSEELRRYKEKLKIINDQDPYELSKNLLSRDPELLPTIEYPDNVNYLVFSPSPFTKDDLKAYKELKAYNQFLCGWV